MDEEKLEFEFKLQGQTMTVKKKNYMYNYVCLDCENQYQGKKKYEKKEALLVDVNFSEYKITIDKEVKNGIWFYIHKSGGLSYFCKAWGNDLVFIIKNNDFNNEFLLTGELRIDVLKKDGKAGTPFMVINFNDESVNQREIS
jgi:hypothetical protein